MPPVGPHPLPVVNTFPPKGPELGPASAGAAPAAGPARAASAIRARRREATARGRAARSVMRVSMREDLGGRNGATGRSPATRRLHRPPKAEGPAWSQDLCRTFTRPGGGQLAATAVAN